MAKNNYGKMANFPSQASQDILQLPGGTTIHLCSIKGQKWLNDANNRIFRYVGGELSFTARKEPSKTGKADYWYAYRKVEGKLRKRYIGKSEDLSGRRLYLIAKALDTPPRAVEDKQENHSTSVVRVPDAIKNEVLFLIEQFHKERKSYKHFQAPHPKYRQMNIDEFLDNSQNQP